VKAKIKFTLPLTLFLFSIVSAQKKDTPDVLFSDFRIPGSSIRAIEAVNDTLLFFAGSNGIFGKISKDLVHLDSIKKIDSHRFHFRSIAFNRKDIFMLSIENPAHMYRFDAYSDDFNAQLVYREEHSKVFYDAMLFKDALIGYALGDPTGSCFSVLKTIDGGNNWYKIDCTELPAIIEGEAAFAASNSNVAVHNNTVWFVSGGKKARVFKSQDNGKKWQVFDTPIVQGEAMTGIFTCDFYNEKNGVIMGGNYDKPTDTKSTKAFTKDGGKTWQLIADQKIPGFISCVRYVPGSKGKKLIAVASTGIYYTGNTGDSWQKISDKPYNTVRFSSKNVAWLGGNEIISKIILNDQD